MSIRKQHLQDFLLWVPVDYVMWEPRVLCHEFYDPLSNHTSDPNTALYHKGENQHADICNKAGKNISAFMNSPFSNALKQFIIYLFRFLYGDMFQIYDS